VSHRTINMKTLRGLQSAEAILFCQMLIKFDKMTEADRVEIRECAITITGGAAATEDQWDAIDFVIQKMF